MRRFTLVTIVVLFVLIAAAAVWQLILAGRDQPRFPGPELGTPFPTATAAP